METVAVVPINIPDLTLTYNYDLLGLFSVSKSPFIISLSLSDKTVKSSRYKSFHYVNFSTI